MNPRSLLEDDKLRIAIAAHSVDRSGEAGSSGEAIASRRFGCYRDRPLRSAHDIVRRIEGRGRPHINNKTLMLGIAFPGNACARLYAEGGVSLGSRDARCRRSCIRGALDIDRAWFVRPIRMCSQQYKALLDRVLCRRRCFFSVHVRLDYAPSRRTTARASRNGWHTVG